MSVLRYPHVENRHFTRTKTNRFVFEHPTVNATGDSIHKGHHPYGVTTVKQKE